MFPPVLPLTESEKDLLRDLSFQRLQDLLRSLPNWQPELQTYLDHALKADPPRIDIQNAKQHLPSWLGQRISTGQVQAAADRHQRSVREAVMDLICLEASPEAVVSLLAKKTRPGWLSFTPDNAPCSVVRSARCQFCGGPINYTIDYLNNLTHQTCVECHHTPGDFYCTCQHCNEKRLGLAQEIRSALLSHADSILKDYALWVHDLENSQNSMGPDDKDFAVKQSLDFKMHQNEIGRWLRLILSENPQTAADFLAVTDKVSDENRAPDYQSLVREAVKHRVMYEVSKWIAPPLPHSFEELLDQHSNGFFEYAYQGDACIIGGGWCFKLEELRTKTMVFS